MISFRTIGPVIVLAMVVGLATPVLSSHRRQPPVNPATERRNDPYWQNALREVYRSTEELKAQNDRELRRGLALAKLYRGNPKKKLLALTFDDGPHPDFTPKLLAILGKEKVRATFFMIGKMVEKYPDLAREVVQAGHVVGNHTFSHVTLTKIPPADVAVEYEAANDVIQKAAAVRPRFCRPPGGDYDAAVIKGAEEAGLTTVLWTDDPLDYASPGDGVLLSRVLGRLSNGGIILLHDGAQETLDVLPTILEYAKRKGYRFVGVDELQRSLNANQPAKRAEAFGPTATNGA